MLVTRADRQIPGSGGGVTPVPWGSEASSFHVEPNGRGIDMYAPKSTLRVGGMNPGLLIAAVVLAGFALAACGGKESVRHSSTRTTPSNSRPTPTSSPVVIKTNVALAEGKISIAAGSAVGGVPFCPGGTAKDQHGTPDVGLVDRTITCSDGTLHMGFDPQSPVGNTQSGPWRMLSGTGAYLGWTGSGQMVVTYDPKDTSGHPGNGTEEFTGTVSR